MFSNKIANILVKWFKRHCRVFPWRVDCDPYHVWVAEVMLQQTRVETVIAYYQRWMKVFPTLQALSQADQQEVLREWEGLGYYSRARNLHKAAKLVIADHKGQIPSEVKALLHLPGIGRSTAGAIASIAFNKDEPILDGNVKRVLARLFNYEKPVSSPQGEKELWDVTWQLLPKGQAGLFNQAIMELGETICLPKNPKCGHCPVAGECSSLKLGIQTLRPVRLKKQKIPHFVVVAAILEERGKLLITQRPANKLLAGMWEFPGGKVENGEDYHQALKREILGELNIEINVGRQLGVYHHAYTHFTVSVHAYYCCRFAGRLKPSEAPRVAWVIPADFNDYPMGKVDRLIARDIASYAF